MQLGLTIRRVPGHLLTFAAGGLDNETFRMDGPCGLGGVGSQASEVMFSFTETGDHLTETFLIDQSPAMYDPNGVGGAYAFSPVVTATVYDNLGGPQNQTIVVPDQFTMTPDGRFNGGFFDQGFSTQWFTGTVDAPTFMPGTYVGAGNNNAYPPQGIPTMTITAVPEPATWLMMFVGLGGLGATLRQRRRTAASAQA